MTDQPRKAGEIVSSLNLLERAGTGIPLPPPDDMPMPDHRLKLEMRDGVRLDTNVWLPDRTNRGPTPVPAILLRTPYKESVLGFKRLGVLRYVEAGYAVVIQQVRGIGASEGRFEFSSPIERTDGYDTIEWMAAQPWCDGAVGMDGSSYAAMMQVAAAAERPPHLKCIVPAVPSLDYFKEVPYSGGVFSRQHTINWLRILQIDSVNELKSGFIGVMPVLSQPEVFQRMTSRPLIDAADGELTGDFLAHYRDALSHSTYDGWFREKTILEDDFAQIDVPALVVSGNFDACIGTLTLWRGLEAHAGDPHNRWLLIGPWDHGQSYSGGKSQYGPYDMGDHSVIDLVALRLKFFDRHLRGVGTGPDLRDRVTIFITGCNRWRDFDHFPPVGVTSHDFYLSSGGNANSSRGDGKLVRTASTLPEPEDRFVDDPTLPFIPAIASALESTLLLDLRERERHHETLVYDSGLLTEPLTILGEPEVDLFVAADAADADVAIWLAERRADGRTVSLAQGQLRLRYREGFETERLLDAGVTVRVRIPLSYIAHEIPAGSSLRLLISGSNFPWADPNPHTAEPIATATVMRSATQSVFHGSQRPSKLILPILPVSKSMTTSGSRGHEPAAAE